MRKNRLLNTTANVLAGLCVAPTILGILILFLIHFEWTSKPIVISSVAPRVLEENAAKLTQVTSESLPNNTTARSSWTTVASTPPIEKRFPPEAVLAGVLFNRRRSFLGRSQDSDGGPCIVAVPAGRCVFVWKGVPPVYADDYDYLALSSKVTFFWKPHQAGEPWPANTVRVPVHTDTSPGEELFYYGRSLGFDGNSLLAGVIRASQSPRLIVLDHASVRLFPKYELLVKLPSQFPNERWLQCFERCNVTDEAVYGGFENGVPTLVGRAFYKSRFSFCKVVHTGCVLLGGQVALIFEYLAESPGTTYEWLQEADSLGRGLSVGGVAVGRSRPMSPDGRLLLGGVLADNSSSGLFACDGREPLASPLRSFQLLVKRASSH
ncbi:uncharacterized protein LOC121835682 [Ixodes scapularis]|uniref:uncharacterized protein LOC121835682 n=1 Tax=Ixodes scapularis TaxID=6945 RepID=UPI001C38E273|nr:uncharacterized protein LOC121835682 [Ixodes scapularis]